MNVNLDARLGEIIASERVRLRMSQQQLASRAGISVRILSNMEQGKISATPREETKERLEEALGWASGDFDQVRAGGDPTAQPRVVSEFDEDTLFVYRALHDASSETIRDVRKMLERHL